MTDAELEQAVNAAWQRATTYDWWADLEQETREIQDNIDTSDDDLSQLQ